MEVVFRLIKDKGKCDGFAREIKEYVEKLPGVASAKVEKTADKHGNYQFALIVKESFDPKKIVKQVKKNINKTIELVSTEKKRIVFRLIEDKDKCDGCALKIKEYVEKLPGVASAKVEKTADKHCNYQFALIVKESFDPKKIVKQVKKNINKRIELVSNEKESVKQVKENTNKSIELVSTERKRIESVSEVNVEALKDLATTELLMAALAEQFTKMKIKRETLMTQLNIDGPKQNKPARQKQETLNPNLPNARVKAVQKNASKKA